MNAACLHVYRSAAGINWVNDDGCLLVIGAGGSYRLNGLEAALWRWLQQDYSYPETLTWYAALSGADPEEARPLLQATLQRWVDNGLLEVADG